MLEIGVCSCVDVHPAEQCTPVTGCYSDVYQEMMLEIGVCACCKVCALSEGSPCGVHTSPCASHLSCTPRDVHSDSDNEDDLLLLFKGEGVCLPSLHGQFNFITSFDCTSCVQTAADSTVKFNEFSLKQGFKTTDVSSSS